MANLFQMDTKIQLAGAFKELFKTEPEYLVRCPGRVNLIGEHIDYSGYGVLPMAIDLSTYLLVSHRDSEHIEFHNVDKSYQSHRFAFTDQWIGNKKIEWYHYLLSGWKGVIDQLQISPKGMNILVSGLIPPSAGLSSSSSIVCAAALATIAINTGKTFELISKNELADLTAKAEQFVGVEGGGMDQAIEILADKGNALLIEFNPLRSEKIYLPENAHFAVLHSGRMLSKAASSQYNERVVECRISAQIIAKKKGISDWKSIRTLGILAKKLERCADEMLKIVEDIFISPVYSRELILNALEISDNEFRLSLLSNNTQEMQEFKLLQRARHVYSEASRVLKFRDACINSDLKTMGLLMNGSHQSCVIDFECSCKELDETVVKRCLKYGALGARLTGAGWGGCVVALFEQKIPELDVLFWSQPAQGIQIQSFNQASRG
ncbi:unnamed protein product [Dracunculus medinensis]|uniref:Galactokinase n=1 Tax=Dracunculus medinensis TaxID=318479 RepID=A0A0N4U218_DRAME|nr:unnamed protein product [Dracunculus medinensis]